MFCVDNLLIINALDHLFIIFYRLFIVLFFVSLQNESYFCNQMKNPFRHLFILLYLRCSTGNIREKILGFSSLLLSLYPIMHKSSWNFEIIHMSFEESETEESASSLSEGNCLDDDFFRIDLESGTSDEEVTDDEMDSQVWSAIKSESDAEFMKDYGLVQEVTSTSGDNIIPPIDSYRHFITDEFIEVMFRETNRYAEQYLQILKYMRLVDDQKVVNKNQLPMWK